MTTPHLTRSSSGRRSTQSMEQPLPKRGAKCTFSFDSSGWMYVYHLGVAQYLQQHVLPLLPPERVAFSGSSGGALVAAALCGHVDIEALTRFVIDCQPECEFNPWRMLPCADEAIATFLPDEVGDTYNYRLRVLVTRVDFRFWKRRFWRGLPFFKPQAVSKWGGRAELGQTLRASCHIPLLGGVLPYSVVRGDGSTLGAFYDGLFWPSILYLWRVFDVTDTVLKVSGFGWPTADIRLPLPVPPHWLVLPPSQTTLWRLYAAGYDDTARYFTDPKRIAERIAAEGASPSAPPLLPSPSDLPPVHGSMTKRWDPALMALIVLGWIQYILLTVLCPLVPFYLFLRNATRPPSDRELQRPLRDHGAAARAAISTGQLLLRGLVVVATLAIWPFALLMVLLRLNWPFDSTAIEAMMQSPVLSPPTSPPRSPNGLRPRLFSVAEEAEDVRSQAGEAEDEAPSDAMALPKAQMAGSGASTPRSQEEPEPTWLREAGEVVGIESPVRARTRQPVFRDMTDKET